MGKNTERERVRGDLATMSNLAHARGRRLSADGVKRQLLPPAPRATPRRLEYGASSRVASLFSTASRREVSRFAARQNTQYPPIHPRLIVDNSEHHCITRNKANMYLVAVFCTLLVAASAEFCYNDVESVCSSKPTSPMIDGPHLPNCNAKYGGIDALQTDLQAYANQHIETSFEFLLMSTHFGNYESNRQGFKGLYRKLSDNDWEKAINLIKYISERGGRMNFNQLPHFKKNSKDSKVLELNELHSLAKALDTKKQLAIEGLRLHSQAKQHGDAAAAHYVEEKFFEPQSEIVRTLAGHTTDLKNLLVKDGALSVFLFDEYLQKTL